MAMFEQKGTPYRRSFGGNLLIAMVLLFLLAGLIVAGTVIHTQLEWKEFQLQFAAGVYGIGMEDGYLKADDTHQAVSVCSDNAVLMLRMMQTGKAVKMGEVRNPQRRIWLHFSDGTHGILSEVKDNQTHIEYTGMNGKHYEFWLGKCKFSNMVTILSVEGANYQNAPWED